MKTIELTISPQGETKIETKGFIGTECQQASEFLEKAIGHRQAEQLTIEFHAQQSVDMNQRQQN